MLCPLRKVSPITINSSGWWFQAFFMFHNRWDNFPIDFHIFQDGYCTTNQSCSVNHRESHGEPGSGHHLRPTLGGLQPQLRGAGERGPLDCRGGHFFGTTVGSAVTHWDHRQNGIRTSNWDFYIGLEI